MRLVAIAMTLLSMSVPSAGQVPPVTPGSTESTGARDFDFQFGDWRVHHRVKRPTGEWDEFEGDCNDRPILGGLGNVEDNVFYNVKDNVFYKAAHFTRGVALRTFEPKTREWAIWWVDGRNPHGALDPAMKGKFVDGVGTFYADGLYNGRQTRTRFIWSHITKASARWEQAFSYDAGKTWDTNWVMDFRRL